MRHRSLSFLEFLTIILLAFVPLLVTFPYRVNIFLSWEGAYRMSQGQLPFRDFGVPLGGMYWVIPAIFFKIFGAQLISLVKAQVFINIIAGLSFRSILKSFSTAPTIRFLSVLVFCISYSFFNFWPWYNHSVIVYELAALAFLLKYLCGPIHQKPALWIGLSGFFVYCSFMTKQDGGALALMICIALLLFHAWYEKKWIDLALFLAFFFGLLGITIVIFSSHGFGYWFNHGQPPHSSRVSVKEIINEFLIASSWIKFYVFLIFILLAFAFRNPKDLLKNKPQSLFLLLTLGILLEATIFQVTSYTPPDNNIFFHSFAIAYLLTLLSRITGSNFQSRKALAIGITGIMLWWSGTYWKYIQRITGLLIPAQTESASTTGENIINRNTYMISKAPADSSDDDDWAFSNLKSFRKIYMPRKTIDGMERLLNMDLVKNRKDLKVLNMSELTPLAAEMPFLLERNGELPLWYHLGVGMFNHQAATFETRIKNGYYDLIIFENIPSLNNFYPFRTRDTLKNYYRLADSFTAPRRGDTQGQIEIYVKPSP